MSRTLIKSIALGAIMLVGCSGLTDVDTSGIVEPSTLNTPTGATALFNGALTIFAGAHNGSFFSSGTIITSSAVVESALLADELGAAGSNFFDVNIDSRTILEADQPFGPVQLYTALSRARVSALSAAQTLQTVTPSSRARIGELFAIAGYSEIEIGELYCAGTTLTDVVAGAPASYGAPLSASEMFQRAAADFDSAALYGKDSAVVLNLAKVGRGRALLNAGQFATAATAVAGVPTSFVFVTEHSAAVQPNWLATGFTSGLFSVSDREGQNGLDFRSANDPRVKFAFVRKGTDGTTDVWGLTVLAPSQATSSVFASGIEARLVEAEAALKANPNDNATTGPGWLGILNTLRATAISRAMPSLADPGNPAARVDLLFRERAFWLFGTGHRLGDLRRLVRQYSRNTEAVFPTGTFRPGRLYGTHANLPPSPVTESRNPSYKGCADRNP